MFADLGYRIDFAIDDAVRFSYRKGREFRSSVKALKAVITALPAAYKAAKHEDEFEIQIPTGLEA